MTNENIKGPRGVSQLCAKQVGTGEMIKYKRELKQKVEQREKTQITERNDDKEFI